MAVTQTARRPATAIAAAALVLALAGCTPPLDRDTAAGPTAAASAEGGPVSVPSASDSPGGQTLRDQLPLRTSLVGESDGSDGSDESSGDLLIEERADGSVWLTLSGLSLTGAIDPRIYLASDPLLEIDGAVRFPADPGYEVGRLTAEADQEHEIIDAEALGSIRSILVLGVGDPGIRQLAAAPVPSSGS